MDHRIGLFYRRAKGVWSKKVQVSLKPSLSQKRDYGKVKVWNVNEHVLKRDRIDPRDLFVFFSVGALHDGLSNLLCRVFMDQSQLGQVTYAQGYCVSRMSPDPVCLIQTTRHNSKCVLERPECYPISTTDAGPFSKPIQLTPSFMHGVLQPSCHQKVCVFITERAWLFNHDKIMSTTRRRMSRIAERSFTSL